MGSASANAINALGSDINTSNYQDSDSEDDKGGVIPSLNAEEPVNLPLLPLIGAQPLTSSFQEDSESEVEPTSSTISLSISRSTPMHNQAPPPPDFYPESFPGRHAGMPTSSGNASPACFGHEDEPMPSENPWAPFNSKLDWEIARWAKLRGPGSTAVSDLLSIDGVCFLSQHL